MCSFGNGLGGGVATFMKTRASVTPRPAHCGGDLPFPWSPGPWDEHHVTSAGSLTDQDSVSPGVSISPLPGEATLSAHAAVSGLGRHRCPCLNFSGWEQGSCLETPLSFPVASGRPRIQPLAAHLHSRGLRVRGGGGWARWPQSRAGGISELVRGDAGGRN